MICTPALSCKSVIITAVFLVPLVVLLVLWLWVNSIFQSSAGFYPSAWYLALQGEHASKEKKFVEAEQLYGEALEQCSGDLSKDAFYAQVSWRLSELLKKNGDYEESVKLMEQALVIETKLGNGKTMLCEKID